MNSAEGEKEHSSVPTTEGEKDHSSVPMGKGGTKVFIVTTGKGSMRLVHAQFDLSPSMTADIPKWAMSGCMEGPRTLRWKRSMEYHLWNAQY